MIRRWAMGVFSRVDAVVSRIENHDALVSAAIDDAQSARARATVQLGQVRRDIQRMQERVTELGLDEQRWKERAARVAEQDEERALECLRRRRRAERERTDLEKRLREHVEIEKRLSDDLARIGERVDQLKRQRNLLRTRQSRAEALSIAQEADGSALRDIDEILSRWETKVTHYELQTDLALGDRDTFAAEYSAEEEKDDLRAELDRLRKA